MAHVSPLQAALDASRERRAVVMFVSPNCGPCKQMKPLIQGMADRLGFHLSILSLDQEGVMTEAYKMGVRVAPTLVILDCGHVIHKHAGATGEERLKHLLDQHKVTQLRIDGDSQ